MDFRKFIWCAAKYFPVALEEMKVKYTYTVLEGLGLYKFLSGQKRLA